MKEPPAEEEAAAVEKEPKAEVDWSLNAGGSINTGNTRSWNINAGTNFSLLKNEHRLTLSYSPTPATSARSSRPISTISLGASVTPAGPALVKTDTTTIFSLVYTLL